jgi:hypothetical protein
MNYPADDNGDALRNMEASGDDLSKRRVIDFSVVFDGLDEAQQFQKRIENADVSAVIDDSGDGSVEAPVSVELTPNHAAISEFEAKLDRLASPFGGRNDGWGCFAVK